MKTGQFFIKTFGCQMNAADSERMTALLAERGMTPTDTLADAELILINGCTVREKAVHKAISALGELQVLKKDRHSPPWIGIGGCVGQLDREKLFQQAPYLDFVFGTDTIDQLPELIHRVQSGERHVIYADFDASMNYSIETKVFGAKALAYVNIMKGCDKYCSYCIVPYTRGKEKSRTIREVLDDVARLVATGVREVTLLGQNVNSFGKGNPNIDQRFPMDLHNVIGKVGPRAGEENFPQLLRALNQDPRCVALKRIRFTSSHPLDFSDELIDCYAPASQGGVSRLASHLHLPVQSGSNRILQKMGRHHPIETYIQQMNRLRELAPHVGLSTDLIVGFPTETEEDFEKTLTLLDTLSFDHVYAFAYSQRPGTRAARMPDDVPVSVKKERLNRLLQYQAKISEKRYADRVGKTMEVLVEGLAKNQQMAASFVPSSSSGFSSDDFDDSTGAAPASAPKVWTGKTSCHCVVNFVSDAPRNWTGQWVNIDILRSSSLSLQGALSQQKEELQ